MYQQVKLDEVCVRKIETISSDENGLIDYFDIASVDNTKKKIISHQSLKVKEAPSRAKQIVQLNDILVSTVRPNLNAIAMIDNKTKNKMVASTGFCVLRASEKIEPRYLFYFVQSPTFINSMTAQATGASYPAVSNSIVKSSHIPLPDLPTQRRIADTLDKVSEGIEVCRKMVDELDLMVKAKFVEMFGDAKVNPFDWVQSTIGASCTLKSGTSLPLEKENEGGNIPYVKVGDMNYVGNEKYITTSSRFVTEETAGVGIFPVGSVVFPKRDGAIGTNKKRLTSVPICADLNVMGVIPGKQLLPQYLLAYFDTIDLGLLNNGSSVPQINNKDIAPLIISIPPIELQEQFATFVSKIDKSRLTIQQVLSKMELEQKVLMQECFGRHVALNILS